jgi:hypothetical protein
MSAQKQLFERDMNMSQKKYVDSRAYEALWWKVDVGRDRLNMQSQCRDPRHVSALSFPFAFDCAPSPEPMR